MLKFKYPPKTLRKIYRYHEYFNAKTIYNLRVFQNNKALKLQKRRKCKHFCLRVFQNNKALKLISRKMFIVISLRVFQNNKALKHG